ncbi:Alpha-pyrone synthesis polyketide synthase-like Pks18 [Aquicella siphonis]|uniref:Alpha-pyrone synthesis polyketide synthase-like Pks18 n=1 Tax=Aquicella siphonis TaxID=254247 RepID=A0A5E4PER4_9COXI|nr:type III polyketide synthase [Aquicella siphonis]VVC74913.1 Alpha-pyrone synthesis polyketide synthase-like Pks18 [Aquicella siphonis]
MKSAITAIGTAAPAYKQSQQAAAEIVAKALQLPPAETRLLKSVYRATGIEFRHSVISDFCRQPGEYEFFPNDTSLPFPSTAARMQAYRRHALALAMDAVRNCLECDARRQPRDVTHLITVSCTGMYAPGLDIELVHALNLDANVKRTCINFMGCYGVFNAIKCADAIVRADVESKVLVVSVELCTLHFQRNDSMDSMISNAIFADGAAAVWIEAETSREKCFRVEAFHCDLLPQHSQEMAWQIADSGFDIVLSSYVPQAIHSGISDFIQRFLRRQAMSMRDIQIFAIHPGGKKILKACEEALSISEHDNRYAYSVLREYGNMSSATILFVLKAIWEDIRSGSSQANIWSCAFGPGLTLESMLLTIRMTQ